MFKTSKLLQVEIIYIDRKLNSFKISNKGDMNLHYVTDIVFSMNM